ncbi:hypothetical protein HON71_02800 [Candidatus Woesearchaeota archaeon]|jgi:Zn-dependent protease|nr:hypothetical protein [Candidatus Woesearchaeota archaeon]MBT5342187.1 hypothetical protein [Candidatus Woesearchaeota archaeon]
MVSWKEVTARIKDFYKFSQQEIVGLIGATIIITFIYSMIENYRIIIDPSKLLLVLIAVIITLFFRVSCQKIYGLSQGQKAEFKVWWIGLGISFVVALLSGGKVPLIFVGGVISTIMVKQRLGEFRYGQSNQVMAITALWGILGNLILAILFAVALYISPQNYFFNQGMIINLVMAFFSLFPFPQLDGLSLFFGSRNLYYVAIAAVLLSAVLLLTKTAFGLIAAIVVGLGVGLFYILIGSEKD